jgi:prolipoprotein diacylglyceryltransferase
LYEAALATGLCAYLTLRRVSRKPGDISLLLLAGYALIRFGTEFLRADNKIYAWGMTFSQVVSVYILVGSAGVASIRATMTGKKSLAPSAEAPQAEVVAVD